MSHVLREEVKRFLGPRWTTRLRCLVHGKGWPRWGNLRRVTPFSKDFGVDRGTPVDRYYLAKFLEMHRALITGDVLEIQMPGYAMRYGITFVESIASTSTRGLARPSCAIWQTLSASFSASDTTASSCPIRSSTCETWTHASGTPFGSSNRAV